MKVSLTRACLQGAMAGIVTETCVIELPDTTDSKPTPIPAGAKKAADDAKVQDWTIDSGFVFPGGGGGKS